MEGETMEKISEKAKEYVDVEMKCDLCNQMIDNMYVVSANFLHPDEDGLKLHQACMDNLQKKVVIPIRVNTTLKMLHELRIFNIDKDRCVTLNIK